MTLTTLLSDDDADIKIEYVQPKYEEISGTDNNRVSRTEIISETAGTNLKTEIDIDEETKQHFTTTNREVSDYFELVDHHQAGIGKKFKCNQCSATFVREYALTRHTKLHTTRTAYTCDYCLKSFSRRNCIRHMKAVHVQKERKVYECHVCGAKYEQLGYLKNHMVLHCDGRTFKCEICSEKFAFQSVLNKHLKSKHNKGTQTQAVRKTYQCEHCPFSTKDSYHLRSHVRKQHAIGTLEPSSSISCKICSKTFSQNSNYRQHLKVHLKLFKCDSCPKAFPNQSKLNLHSAVHSSLDPVCPICDHTVKRGYTLERHMKKHVSEKNFKCHVCPGAFTLQANLEKHLLRHEIGKKYQCYMCSFGSKTLAILEFHFAKHIGKEIFKCKVCFKRFFQKDHWQSHESQHISGTFPCERCPKTFPYALSLKRHVALQHNLSLFECTTCLKVFRTKCGLKRHTQSIHNADMTEKKFQCKICSKKFFEKHQLNKHERNVHRERETTELKYRCTICTYATHNNNALRAHYVWHKSERPHGCVECSKTFKTRSCVSTHMKWCHSKEPRIYTCKICLLTFNDRSSRLKHKRVHQERRIHRCSICLFEAKTEFKLLKVHMNVHTQPFKCEICLKKFSTKGNFNRHQKTHGLKSNGLPDNDKKFECYICGHIARGGAEKLKIHFSKHTGEKLFKCNICSRSFARPDYLKLHLRLHTGKSTQPIFCSFSFFKFNLKF